MKVERLMAITMLLLNRKRVQATELSETLEVSLRTIYRDMESLSLAGIPIVSHTGGNGGFEIMEHFRLERQLLSYKELVVMYTALRGLESTQAMSHNNLNRLLDKVGAMVAKAESNSLSGSQQIHVDFTPWNRSEQEMKKYDLLSQAVENHQRIHFTYTDRLGQDTIRNVEPEKLVLNGYAWYLHGYCLERKDYRMFKLSRIQHLQVTMDTFVRKDSSTLQQIEPHSLFFSEDTNQAAVELSLLFTATVKADVLDHFDEHEIEQKEDGTILVETTWPEQPWVIPFLMQFGTNVYVLKPDWLAAQIKEEAYKLWKLYNK